MRKVRIVLLLVVLLLTLTVSVQMAGASPPTQYRVHITEATIPWGFPIGDFCPYFPQIPFPIGPDDFGSNRVKHVTELVKADGSKQVVVTDLITGTASDAFGGAYGFIYENDATFTNDGWTTRVSMKDTFRLSGPTSFTVGFNWRWAYEADSLDVTPVLDGGQVVDVQISPNLPPTEDGVTEAPFIVPGSWRILNTRGDPWNCDPL